MSTAIVKVSNAPLLNKPGSYLARLQEAGVVPRSGRRSWAAGDARRVW